MTKHYTHSGLAVLVAGALLAARLGGTDTDGDGVPDVRDALAYEAAFTFPPMDDPNYGYVDLGVGAPIDMNDYGDVLFYDGGYWLYSGGAYQSLPNDVEWIGVDNSGDVWGAYNYGVWPSLDWMAWWNNWWPDFGMEWWLLGGDAVSGEVGYLPANWSHGSTYRATVEDVGPFFAGAGLGDYFMPRDGGLQFPLGTWRMLDNVEGPQYGTYLMRWNGGFYFANGQDWPWDTHAYTFQIYDIPGDLQLVYDANYGVDFSNADYPNYERFVTFADSGWSIMGADSYNSPITHAPTYGDESPAMGRGNWPGCCRRPWPRGAGCP